MNIIVLKDKEEYDLIINSVIRDGLTIHELIDVLKEKGIDRDEYLISNVIKHHLRGKKVFFEVGDIDIIKQMYEHNNQSVPDILKSYTQKGIKINKVDLYKVIRLYKFKKGFIFKDTEKELITRLYTEEGMSVVNIAEKLKMIDSNYNIQKVSAFLSEWGLVKNRAWSEKDLDILKQYYPKGGCTLCLKKGLDRPSKDIVSKATSLDLFYEMVYKNWTEYEDNFLRENYDKLDRYVLSSTLKRSIYSINNRLFKLGLLQNSSWKESDLKLLEMYYPKGGAYLCIEKGLEKKKGAILSKAHRMGIRYKNLDTWTDTDLNILKKYYPIGGSKLCRENGITDRPTYLINNKASELGLTSGVRKGKNVAWSDYEVGLLKKYYPIGGYKLCIEKGLDRTKIAIMQRANKLKLLKPSN